MAPIGDKDSIVERIIHALTQSIIKGDLKPGDKIPTEPELAQMFQVGRNSVREAIKVLSHFGVVEIKRADGTFISRKFNSRMLDPMLYGIILQSDSASDILELREVFDIGILLVVIKRCTLDTVENIKAAYKSMEAAIADKSNSPEAVLEQDISFHSTISASIDNKLINEVAGYIDRITIPSRIATMDAIMKGGQQDEFLKLHLDIVRIIENKESDKVVSAVNDHYRYWRKI